MRLELACINVGSKQVNSAVFVGRLDHSYAVIVIVIVFVNTTSYIAPLVASHFYDASQERSLSALYYYLMLGIIDQVQFQLFFESRKCFGFPNSCRKTVPNTWTSDLKGPIAHFSLGYWHENIRRV